MPKENVKRITSIGGQALIEGIVMRGPKKTCVAVRHKTDGIVLEELSYRPAKEKYPVLGWPFIRGIVSFVESMRVGYRALQLSIEKSGYEEEEGEPSKFDQWLERTLGKKANAVIMTVGTVLGVVLAVALFFFLPTWLFNLAAARLGRRRRVARGSGGRDADPDLFGLCGAVRPHAGYQARFPVPRRGA